MRSTVGGSRLVGLLGGWVPQEAEASGMDFAERMGLWLGPLDAIRLQAAHQSLRALKAPLRGPAPRHATDPAADLQRVRDAIARAIAQDPQLLDAAAPAYTAFRQRHLELQAQMEFQVEPLRAHLRERLAQASPRLRQLAALDEAMEQVLAPRAQAILAGLPALLQQRFEQCRRDAAEGWLAAFLAEWREALLAERDLRLEPVAGLVDALRNATDFART